MRIDKERYGKDRGGTFQLSPGVTKDLFGSSVHGPPGVIAFQGFRLPVEGKAVNVALPFLPATCMALGLLPGRALSSVQVA